MEWEEFVAEAKASGIGAYLATAGADGRPHVAFVGIGLADRTMWTATFRSSAKGRNLRANREVALQWPEGPTRRLFGWATARLVDDPAEAKALWDAEVLPYPAGEFWSSPEDPELLFVELVPSRLSLYRGESRTPPEVWRPAAA